MGKFCCRYSLARRGAELPESFWTEPLMYMGASDAFIGANEDVLAESEEWGIDFEAEVVVFTDDVPAGIKARKARQHIKLVALVNDVSDTGLRVDVVCGRAPAPGTPITNSSAVSRPYSA